MKNVYARNWAFIVYDEELLKGLRSVAGVRGAISPLHHGDKEEVKEHYHVLISGEKQSVEQIKDLISNFAEVADEEKRTFKNVSIPVKVQNLGSYVRYLIHADDKDKEQFTDGVSSIETLGGFDAVKFFEDEKSSLSTAMELLNFIKTEKMSFRKLVNLCVSLGKSEWLELLMNRSYFYNLYLSSDDNDIEVVGEVVEEVEGLSIDDIEKMEDEDEDTKDNQEDSAPCDPRPHSLADDALDIF